MTTAERRAQIDAANTANAAQNAAILAAAGQPYYLPGVTYGSGQVEAANSYLDTMGAQDAEPSGSGSGYATAAYAAPAPYNVNEDPSYLAFIAALDQAQTQAGSVRQQALADADTQLTTYKPRIAEAGVESRRGISGLHEMRGMFRSGARLRDIGLQQRAEGQQVADLERGVARAKTVANQNYDSAIADLARQRAERALQLTSANAGI